MESPLLEQSGEEPADLTHAEREAGMRWIVWDGVLASSMGSLLGGVFLTGFALLLGASETAIGILSGLPRFSALMQPLGSYFVERLRQRKGISVWGFGPARMLWFMVIIMPLLVIIVGLLIFFRRRERIAAVPSTSSAGTPGEKTEEKSA